MMQQARASSRVVFRNPDILISETQAFNVKWPSCRHGCVQIDLGSTVKTGLSLIRRVPLTTAGLSRRSWCDNIQVRSREEAFLGR